MARMNMVKREEPKLFKFEAEGSLIAGVLLAIDQVKMENGMAGRLLIREEESGEFFVVMVTADMKSKIRISDVGHVIEIRYTGEDHSVRRGNNSMRRFDVFVSDELFKEGDLAITGADVGF